MKTAKQWAEDFTETVQRKAGFTLDQSEQLETIRATAEHYFAEVMKQQPLPSASEYDDNQRISIAKERYRQAAHAVQTGIAFATDKTDQTSKHLRVGLDLSKSDQAGLAALLISKGVFSMADYIEAIADQAEIEAEMRAKEIGPNVKLR